MPKLVIVLDVDSVDTTLNDPWVVVDEILSASMPTFEAGGSFSVDALGLNQADKVSGTMVGAEWDA